MEQGGSTMNVTLAEVTADNWKECVDLRLASGQRHFVASNLWSIAESKFDPTSVPLAIYAGPTMVGFVVYLFDREDRNWWVHRIMIDRDHQGKGYGRAAMRLVIDRIKHEHPHIDQIAICYEPDNDTARTLYASLGFVETGEVMYEEVVARLFLKVAAGSKLPALPGIVHEGEVVALAAARAE
jgi:diamine N-acetyltransferase